LPVHNLNEILLLSVGTQSMHGAEKTGMAYLIDGVDVSKVMYKNGAFADGYTVVNRNGNSFSSPTGSWDAVASSNYLNGRQSGMIRTAVQLTENEIATAEVHVGTIPASYSASGGVVNLTTRNGGDKLTGALNLRSSVGHLNHAGPDLYNNNPEHNPDYLNGYSVAEQYFKQRDALLQSGSEFQQKEGKAMDWYPGRYHYGDKPRINGDFTLGGSIGKKLKFFLAADVLNDYGTLPAQFQRQIGASLKLNYQLNPKNNFTLYGKVSDQGKIGGWVNRSFSYYYLFNPELNPVHQGLELMSYAKWQHDFSQNNNLELTVSYVGDYHTWGYKLVEEDGKLTFSAIDAGNDWLLIETYEDIVKYLWDPETRIFDDGPGGSIGPYLYVAGHQIKYAEPVFSYEDLKTEQLTTKAVWSKSVNPHHKVSAGANYSRHHIARKTAGHPYWLTYTADFQINPWEAGGFFQDRITYCGIQAVIGCRFDAYQNGTQVLADIFTPGIVEKNLLYEYYSGIIPEYNGKADPAISASPRIAVSHPITQSSFMHYSWGLYTTPPDFSNLLYLYDFNNFPNLPKFRDQNMAPEKSTAWEMG
ncbi:hypothetical protein KAH55_09300, partial [bacterium]|nr:hypothetical protein [bacterium]